MGHLSLLSELDVVLIKDNFLNVMSWHLSHKKTLHIAFFEPLHDLILKTKELQYLLKHGGRHRSLLTLTLWHLTSGLLCVNLNALGPISELVELSKDLRCLFLELSL